MSLPTYKNELAEARLRRGLSKEQVGRLLSKHAYTVQRYEEGTVVPSLREAIALEILYRTPLAALFPDFYNERRKKLRSDEEALV